MMILQGRWLTGAGLNSIKYLYQLGPSKCSAASTKQAVDIAHLKVSASKHILLAQSSLSCGRAAH